MAKETNYFQHDYNARNNLKIKRLVKVYGAAGYGLYWVLAEMMHEDERSGITIEEDLIEVLADDYRMTIDEVKAIVDDCVGKFKLMFENDGLYTAERVLENKDRRVAIKELRSQAGKEGAKKRWQNGKPIANAIKSMANAINPIANANGKIANDSKGKESKGKETKDLLIKKKQQDFGESLIPFVETYGKEMIRAFFDHWQQPNKSMTQIRWEMEKTWDLAARLRTWDGNRQNFNKGSKQYAPEASTQTKVKTAQEILNERQAKTRS